MATKEGNLRVWWIQNPPAKPELYPVQSTDEAIAKLKELEERDLREPSVISNAGGLEVFEGGEWGEYYDEEGRDIDKIRQIEAETLRLLRHPSRSRKLREFIDATES